MTSRVQHRRTSTPNNPPVGLAPGELSIEMAEPRNLWVGVPTALDPSGRKLLATGDPANWITKAYVDNANAAQDATIATKADKTYVDAQDNAQNVVIAQKADKTYVDSQDALKVSKTGDTMSGPLTVPAPPVNPGHAASKSYVDGQIAAVAQFPEAPNDAFHYGRHQLAWAKVLADSPLDTNAYGRKNGAWVDVAEEAPADGLTYGRSNGTWKVSVGGATPSDTPPAGPLVNGQLWFRSTIASLYCYYDDTVGAPQWVQVSASPQMVDNNYRRKTANRYNMVCNGALNVSQENGNTEGATANYYAADQMMGVLAATSAAYGFGRIAAVNPSGSRYRLRLRVTTAKASLAASDYMLMVSTLEGLNTQDLNWANPVGQKDAVLTFGFNGPAGTYCASIGNPAGAYSFLAPFTISAGQANTDTVQTIKVPAPGPAMTAWNVDNTGAVTVIICPAAGPTFTSPTVGWNSGNFLGVTGMSNGLAAVQSFQVWDIGLYADPDKTGLAPLFEVEDYATTLAKCQRYFQTYAAGNLITAGYATAAAGYYGMLYYSAPMRIAPTAAAVGLVYNNSSGFAFDVGSTIAYRNHAVATATGTAYATYGATLNARM